MQPRKKKGLKKAKKLGKTKTLSGGKAVSAIKTLMPTPADPD